MALSSLPARHQPALFPAQPQSNSPLPGKARWALSGQLVGCIARCRGRARADPAGSSRERSGAACGTRTLRTSRGRARPSATPGRGARPGRAMEVRPPPQRGARAPHAARPPSPAGERSRGAVPERRRAASRHRPPRAAAMPALPSRRAT